MKQCAYCTKILIIVISLIKYIRNKLANEQIDSY